MLLMTSLANAANGLDMNVPSCRKSKEKLRKRRMVQRVKHNYFESRIFMKLANSERRLYGALVDNI